jgi:hemerythrin
MIGFPGIEAHKEDHEKLYALFSKQVTQVKRESIPEMFDLIISNRERLFNHMATFDKDYTDFTENLIKVKKKFKLNALEAQVLVE